MKLELRKFLARGAFILAVIAVGFALERAWLAWKSRAPDVVRVPGRTRILLLGGSIAVGTGEKIEYHLRRKANRDDIDVVELSSPMLSVDDLSRNVVKVIEKHDPSVIALQVGILEREVTHVEWASKANVLMESGQFAELSEMIRREISAGHLSDPMRFIGREQGRLREAKFADHFVPLLTRTLDAFAPGDFSKPELRARALWLLSMGFWIVPNESALLEGLSIPDASLARMYRARFRYLEAALRSWPKQFESSSFAEFVRSDDHFERLFRYWFWITWSNRDPVKDRDPFDFYSKHPEFLYHVLPGLNKFHTRKPVLKLLEDAEPRVLVQAMVNYEWEFPKLEYTLTVDKLPEVLDSIRERGLIPVILQYPDWENDVLEEIGSQKQVTVIGDGGAFREPIQKNGRATYFLDTMAGTGHLTDAGLEIYSRAVAERLAPELEKSLEKSPTGQ